LSRSHALSFFIPHHDKFKWNFDTEAIAKLLCRRKSMILMPVFRASKLARAAQMRPCPDGQARLRGEKRRQKGDFMGHMSFAIASTDITGLNARRSQGRR
jgi:hypothetical protein